MNTRESIDVLFDSTSLSTCINAAVQAAAGKKVLMVEKSPFFGGSVDCARSLQEIHSSDCDISTIQIEKSWCSPQAQSILIDFGACPLGTRHPVVDSCIELKISSDYLSMIEVKPLYYLFEGRHYKLPLSKEDVFSDRSFSLLKKRSFMRILDQVETLSMETLSTFDPLFREMVLFGYCNFASALEAENASDETIKSRLQKFKSAIGRFHPSCSDIDDEEHDGNDVIGKACTPTSPMLFPQHSNFEILQVFIRKACVFGSTIILNASISNFVQMENDSCQFSVLQDSESHWTLRSNTLAASALAEPICADASCAALVLSCSSTANVPIPSMHNGACFASSLYHGTVINVLCLGSATGCTPAETSLAIFSKLHV